MSKYFKKILILPIVAVILLIGAIYVFSSGSKKTNFISQIYTKKTPGISAPLGENKQEEKEGKHILVNLNSMKVELHDGTTTIDTLDIVAQGPTGKYYETIVGEYVNDYSIRNHFSSIGHVYMPYSVHIFGNFFFHGIPYYPDGTKVDTTYSGGCIRLEDEDAKAIYDFVEPGTPIIITRDSEFDFSPTSTTTTAVEDMEMTRLMTVVISLEVLPQDNEILDTDRSTPTTRRKLIPRILIDHDLKVSELYTYALGEPTFVDYMNQRAKSLGLTNTTFTGVKEPATTSVEDLERFNDFVNKYKSYLLQFTPLENSI